jgi:putative addiction module component (TIGR02574 family)
MAINAGYARPMSIEQLSRQALALPLPERVALAEALWQSIDERGEVDADDEEREAVEQARKRDAELVSGVITGRTHYQVMEAARRVLERG